MLTTRWTPAVVLLAVLLPTHEIGAQPSATAESMVEALADFQFDQLGHPQIQSDSIQPALAPVSRPHRLLILPVRFSDIGYDLSLIHI